MNVLVLEASDGVGGRVRTDEVEVRLSPFARRARRARAAAAPMRPRRARHTLTRARTATARGRTLCGVARRRLFRRGIGR